MKKIAIKTTLLLFSIFTLSFTVNSDSANYGISINKSVTQVKDDLYQVTVKVNNGSEVNGIARYELKLPITADFVQQVIKDKTINFKVDGRKLKMLWMHIQKNRSYTAVFQFKSKLEVAKLKMHGSFSVHKEGQMVSFSDTTALSPY